MTFKFDHQERQAPKHLSEVDINLQIGRRLRRRRRLLGLTQTQLSEDLGLKFQQIQKYECAANRICAARLFRLASKLQVPVQYFFDGLPQAGEAANDTLPEVAELSSSKEAHDLLAAYFRLPDTVRRKLREFANALGDERA